MSGTKGAEQLRRTLGVRFPAVSLISMSQEALIAADPQSASLADWLQGWGTAGALVVSVVLLGLDVISRRQATAQDLRRQARRVQLSVPEHSGGRVSSAHTASDTEYWMDVNPKVSIMNLSDETITDLILEVGVDPPMAARGPSAEGASIGWPRLGGGESKTHAFPLVLVLNRERAEKTPPIYEPVPSVLWSSVTFTDAAGNRWRRDRNHNLILQHRAGRRQG